MSFVFAQLHLSQSANANWRATAAAWRGCCLEIFSRAERSIDNCIAQLETQGRSIGHDAHHPGARSRHRALQDYLASEPFTPHCGAAVRKLAEWETIVSDRPWIAHGEMIVEPSGVRFRLAAHDGKPALPATPRSFDRFAMLALLRRADAAQWALHDQLGQIGAAARRIGPQPG